MTAQFTHWTERDIIDLYIMGRKPKWIAERSGRSIADVQQIILPRNN